MGGQGSGGSRPNSGRKSEGKVDTRFSIKPINLKWLAGEALRLGYRSRSAMLDAWIDKARTKK